MFVFSDNFHYHVQLLLMFLVFQKFTLTCVCRARVAAPPASEAPAPRLRGSDARAARWYVSDTWDFRGASCPVVTHEDVVGLGFPWQLALSRPSVRQGLSLPGWSKPDTLQSVNMSCRMFTALERVVLPCVPRKAQIVPIVLTWGSGKLGKQHSL